MSFSSGGADFTLAYELAPIILIGGIAGSNLTSGGLPITSYTEGASFPAGILSSASTNISIDDYFAHFVLEPGSSLLELEVAKYPMLNLTIAANAVITQPLRVVLRMICPARASQPYSRKQSVMTSLVNTLNAHISAGGTFNVNTPAYLYTGLILESLRDASPPVDGRNGQVQSEYLWSFLQPLISVASSTQAQNTQMQRITNQTQIFGDPPGSANLVSQVGSNSPPNMGALIPAASGNPGGAVATPQGPGSA